MLSFMPQTRPRPPETAIDKAKSMLDRALGPSKVMTGRNQCESYASDESDARGMVPDVVVLAHDADDIAKALEIADATDVPITPRAGGSGLTGGCVPVSGGIVLMTLGMASIK